MTRVGSSLLKAEVPGAVVAEASDAGNSSARRAKYLRPNRCVAPDALSVFDQLPDGELDRGENRVRKGGAHEPEVVHVLVQRLDEPGVIDQQQATLRQSTGHLVGRLCDKVGARFFGAAGQQVAEAEMRRVRGVYYNGKVALVGDRDEGVNLADNAKVVW